MPGSLPSIFLEKTCLLVSKNCHYNFSLPFAHATFCVKTSFLNFLSNDIWLNAFSWNKVVHGDSALPTNGTRSEKFGKHWSRSFWLRFQLQTNLLQKIRKITLYYLYNSLVPQTISVHPEPKFQASTPPSKSFWLRLQPSKIAATPAPQPCCVLGSFILARVAGQCIVRLKLFSKGNCPLDWNSNPMFYTNSLPQRTFNPIWIMFLKIFNCIGQLGLYWLSPSKERANEVERAPTTNNIVLFRSPAKWTRKVRHGSKTYEEWQGPKKRVGVSNLVKWDWWWWHKHRKQSSLLAFSNVNHNQRLGLSP